MRLLCDLTPWLVAEVLFILLKGKMSVTVSIFDPVMQQYINQDSVEVDGSTVGECLDDLIRQFPDVEKWMFDERRQLRRSVFVYVNAESTHKVDMAKPVKDNDKIIIAVLITGG